MLSAAKAVLIDFVRFRNAIKGSVMSSEKQVAANHANSLKSTGPKSAAGRRRASLNARKHGLRSRRKDCARRQRVCPGGTAAKWLAEHDAQTDYDEFMISSSVSLVCDVERAPRVQAADQFSENEISDQKAAEEAEELGSLLFFDPGGPVALYGNDPVFVDTIALSVAARLGTSLGRPAGTSTPVAVRCDLPVLRSEMGSLLDREVGAQGDRFGGSGQGDRSIGFSLRPRPRRRGEPDGHDRNDR